MKLLSIRLNDVRRFSSPVVVEDIGPGLNLLCAPNESGKSTVFDALQAVFAQKHRANTKEVRSLRARTGGAPEVSVEIETAEGRFEIAKRWSSKASAEIRRDGMLLHKADEAEDWIARVMDADDGPAGLLWVRQGETGLGDGAGEAGLRRSLLSSVAGEVEAMTGGRRMDRVLSKCREALGAYLTPTGQAKTGGPLKRAQEEVAALGAEVERLSGEADRLHAALNRRREVRRELAELADPEAAAARARALTAAEAACAAAERHAERLETAEGRARMARLTLETSRRRLEDLRKARAEETEAGEALTAGNAALAEARTQREKTGEALRIARSAEQAAEAARKAADQALARAHAAAAAEHQRHRRRELAARLADAEALRTKAERLAAEAKAGPDAAAMRALEALSQETRTLRAAREREAPGLIMRHIPGGEGGVTLDGAPLPEGERSAIPEGAELELRGLGRLRIEPGRGADGAAALEEAEARLAEALDAAGAASPEAARSAADKRAAAEAARRETQARLGAVAPEGLETLREALALLPDPAPDPDAPPVEDAKAQAETTRTAHDAAAAALEAADREARREEQAEIRAAATQGAAADRARRAADALAGLAETDEAALSARIEIEAAALAQIEADRLALAEAAPDREAAAAELARARGAVDNADAAKSRLEIEQAGLSREIDLGDGDAVEEKLADHRVRLDKARASLERIAFDVKVLTRLAAALEEARSAARDRFFAPVMAELKPLLSLLWEEAELRFDETRILPEALVRRGADEPFDILSGGTQEQIAILVRLAFAQMLAKGGRGAPVILDDALVHSDDDRIESMFRALHRQAKDMQIIVLSCRRRAFRDLGARALTIRPAPQDGGA